MMEERGWGLAVGGCGKSVSDEKTVRSVAEVSHRGCFRAKTKISADECCSIRRWEREEKHGTR